MQLNIYIISHPIIQQLSSQIINLELIRPNTYSQSYKQLGILMIYEVMRKWIQTQNIYIKELHSIKKFCVFEQNESYLIITDLVDSYNMITEVLNLIPNVELKHVNFRNKLQKINHNEFNHISTINIQKKQKIIIIYPHLNNYTLIQFLDYLILQKHVKISQIKIICITCDHKVLEKIGDSCPHLSIYTTKITKD